jgi:5-methylcytosine-specific restriction endonuclease McrA
MSELARCVECPYEGTYDADQHSTCHECYLDRRAEYSDCIWCGKWHSPKYETCFSCRQIPGREEAAVNLRLLICGRDNWTCQMCGDTDGPFQVDHVMPCAAGGTADQWNLQCLCAKCNRQKGSTWWVGSKYSDRRQELVEAYYVRLWLYLDPDEKRRLQDEVDNWLTMPGGKPVPL